MLSGLFDPHPGVQIVLGHLAEGLPFLLPRPEHPGKPAQLSWPAHQPSRRHNRRIGIARLGDDQPDDWVVPATRVPVRRTSGGGLT
jgi:hypothetical protein